MTAARAPEVIIRRELGSGEEVYVTSGETESSNTTGEAAAQNLHAVAQPDERAASVVRRVFRWLTSDRVVEQDVRPACRQGENALAVEVGEQLAAFPFPWCGSDSEHPVQ